jgi:hypothetical protein
MLQRPSVRFAKGTAPFLIVIVRLVSSRESRSLVRDPPTAARSQLALRHMGLRPLTRVANGLVIALTKPPCIRDHRRVRGLTLQFENWN